MWIGKEWNMPLLWPWIPVSYITIKYKIVDDVFVLLHFTLGILSLNFFGSRQQKITTAQNHVKWDRTNTNRHRARARNQQQKTKQFIRHPEPNKADKVEILIIFPSHLFHQANITWGSKYLVLLCVFFFIRFAVFCRTGTINHNEFFFSLICLW